MRKISTSTTPSNLVINKFPNREVYEKIKAKGSLGEDDVNVLEDYGYTLTETDKTEIAGKVIADGTEFTLSEFPTALKNPHALTFTGAVTGTYDGSEEKTINIPSGGSADLPPVLGNFNAAMQDAAAGSIPVYTGDEAWEIEKLITEFNENTPLSGYIPDTAWVAAYMAAQKALLKLLPDSTAADAGKLLQVGADGNAAWGDKQEIIDDINPAYYIDLTGNYPNYTCPVAMADIKAAYEAKKVLECRCAMGQYTAVLPLFIPMPSANTWIFSGAGAMTTMNFTAQSLTIAIVNGAVEASNTWLASINDIPTALKNPNALTVKIGDTSVTYDGSEVKTVEIPEGGSCGSPGGGGLQKMSAVSSYIGIPAAELPQDGTIWMCISNKGDGAELYSGTVTIEGGSLTANNLIAVSSGSVIQLNQATTIGAGFVLYGMSATDYVGVWQQVGAGSAAINWRGEWAEAAKYSKLDAVSYEGSSYIFASDTPNIGAIPGVDGEWQLMAQKGAAGKTPVKGTDYWTAADKASIVQDTLNALPTWTGGSY